MSAANKASPEQFQQLVGDTFGDPDNGQGQLFTPPEPPVRKTGDLSPAEWNAREDVSFHGTLVPPDRQPFDQEYMHTGSQRAASSIMKTRSKPQGRERELDFNSVEFVPREDLDMGDEEDDGWDDGRVGELHDNESYDDYGDPDFTPIIQDAPGRIMGFRRTGPEVKSGDRTANIAHTLALTGDHGGFAEIPASIRDTINLGSPMDSRIATIYERDIEASHQLGSGSTLAYSNGAEDIGSTSYVARRDSMRSYAEDVVNNSNRPDSVKEAWAQHIAGGHEGPHVPFEQLVGYQGRLPLGDREFTVDTPLFNTVTKLKPVPQLQQPKKKKAAET